jgi:hypothetical protein
MFRSKFGLSKGNLVQLNWVEVQWQKVVTQCMTEVRAQMEVKLSQVSQQKKKEYLMILRDAMIVSLQKSEMWLQFIQDVNVEFKRQVEADRMWHSRATVEAEEKQAHFEECQSAWALQDDMCKRLQILEPIIDKMLPLDGDNTRSYTNQQAIRSRGMVIAAMFGLQSIGGPSLAEPAETHAKKPAKATKDYTYRGFAPEPKDTPPINMDGLGL